MGDRRPIGVFDSGIGGLTVLREVQRQLPDEACIYLADSREAPYGTRPAPWVRARCERIVGYLLDQEAKLVVVACNAASVTALGHLRERYAVPFVGIVPAVKPAATRTRSGRIGVLTTPITADSGPLAALIEQFTHGVAVMTQVCPGLVPLVERGIVDGPQVDALLREYLQPMLAAGVDVVVLGCTHYPFLRTAIERICGPDVELLDPAAAVARQVGRVLTTQSLAAEGGNAAYRYVTTGDPAEFERVLCALVGPVQGPIEGVML